MQVLEGQIAGVDAPVDDGSVLRFGQEFRPAVFGAAVAQTDRHIVGDGNVIGDHSTAIVLKAGGDLSVRIGQLHVTLSPDQLRALLAGAYTPPPLPDLDTLPGPGPLPPGSRIPFARNALFTGREEPLKALARALLHNNRPFVLVGGIGGIGKTQLAVEFAYRCGCFFQGVHWINAAQPDAAGTTGSGVIRNA